MPADQIPQSRVVSVAPAVEIARDEPEDRRTRVARVRPSRAALLKDAPGTFERHREALTQLVSAQRGAGYLAVVVSARGVVGTAWNKAGPRPRVATIGRHSCCDVTVPGDDEVSLRHLVLLVRGAVDQPARGRLFDLASTNGSQAMKSVELGERAAVRIPGHWVFFFRTREGDNTLSAEVAFVDASRPAPRARGRGGRLEFVGEVASERLSGERLAEGVLLGRYERCLHERFDCAPSVSRVHAVLVEDGGDTLIFDVGSTNGVFVNGDDCRARVLSAGDEVRLGQVAFEWCPDRPSVSADRPLFPEGVADVLRDAVSRGGLPVFADWLLARGSRWGEWIAAALQGATARATALEEELEFLMLGPLAGLVERRWEQGVLVSAKLEAGRLNWPKAMGWPLWAGLRTLDTDEQSDGDWVRLYETGALRSLRDTTVWTGASVRCLGAAPCELTTLRVRGEEAMRALVEVLPSLGRLEVLQLSGPVPSVLNDALASPEALPGLRSLRLNA